MPSPLFFVRVLAKTGPTVRLRISLLEEGGFGLEDPRHLLEVVGYGRDFLLPDGTFDHGREKRSVLAREIDRETQLWNDEWLARNVSRYVTRARFLVQVNHPWVGTFKPAMRAVQNIRSRDEAERHYALDDYPHCIVELTVADPAYLDHLEPDLIYSMHRSRR